MGIKTVNGKEKQHNTDKIIIVLLFQSKPKDTKQKLQ